MEFFFLRHEIFCPQKVLNKAKLRIQGVKVFKLFFLRHEIFCPQKVLNKAKGIQAMRIYC